MLEVTVDLLGTEDGSDITAIRRATFEVTVDKHPEAAK